MMFWVLAAVMTVAVTISLLIPLARHRQTTTQVDDTDAYDVEVYHDQLREIERDVAGGSLSADQAEYARAEVARRLLKASRGENRSVYSSGGLGRIGQWVVILILPLVAVVGYLTIGNPGMPSQPLAARVVPAAPTNGGGDIRVLVAQAEKHLATNPQDGRGWDVLAPIYLGLNRMQESETAYRNALRLLGPSVARHTGLGQALFAQSGGIVTAEVQETFVAAQSLEPDNPLSAYFLALGLAQEGRTDDARSGFAELASNSPADAPWMPLVREHLVRLGGGEDMADQSAMAGPDAAAVEAAAEMSGEERMEMISGMVAGLDAKLRADPDNLPGWLRLVRSYMILGKPQEASDALARALEKFDGANEARQALMDAATQFGLEPKELEQ